MERKDIPPTPLEYTLPSEHGVITVTTQLPLERCLHAIDRDLRGLEVGGNMLYFPNYDSYLTLVGSALSQPEYVYTDGELRITDGLRATIRVSRGQAGGYNFNGASYIAWMGGAEVADDPFLYYIQTNIKIGQLRQMSQDLGLRRIGFQYAWTKERIAHHHTRPTW